MEQKCITGDDVFVVIEAGLDNLESKAEVELQGCFIENMNMESQVTQVVEPSPLEHNLQKLTSQPLSSVLIMDSNSHNVQRLVLNLGTDCSNETSCVEEPNTNGIQKDIIETIVVNNRKQTVMEVLECRKIISVDGTQKHTVANNYGGDYLLYKSDKHAQAIVFEDCYDDCWIPRLRLATNTKKRVLLRTKSKLMTVFFAH